MNGGTEIARAYAQLGNKKRATEVADALWKVSQQYLTWYLSQSPSYFMASQNECQLHIQIMDVLLNTMSDVDEKWVDSHESQLNSLLGTFQQKGGAM